LHGAWGREGKERDATIKFIASTQELKEAPEGIKIKDPPPQNGPFAKNFIMKLIKLVNLLRGSDKKPSVGGNWPLGRTLLTPDLDHSQD